MFQTEISAGLKIRAVRAEEITRTRIELGLTDYDKLDPTILGQIRTNLAADFILRGHYVSVGETSGTQLRLDLELIDTTTGDTVFSVPETGTVTTLFAMVTHAGSVLRRRLGVQDLTPAEVTELQRSKPSSLKAEQLYSQGLERLRTFDGVGARQALSQATDADPEFALAHLGLADACLILGYEAEASRHATKAVSLSGHLARDLYLWIRGRDREIAKDWATAIDTYRSLWLVFPDNLEYGLRLTKALTSAGKGNDAFTTIDEIRRLPRPLSDDPRIDLAEAGTAEALGEFKREKSAAAKTARKAAASGAHLLEAAADLRGCWALNNLGDRNEALKLAEHARTTYRTLGDRGGEAQALKNMADLLDDQGDHKKAQVAYEAALTLFRQVGYETGAAVTLNNLAYALKYQGDLAAAKKMFEESLIISRRIKDRGRAALPLSGLGGVLWRQGDLIGAKEMYDQALAVYLERNDNAHAATVIGNIGLVLQDDGNLIEARNKLDQSLAMLRKIDDKPGIARTLGNIGELLLKQGDLGGARRKFEDHLALARAMADERQIAYALHELGEVSFYSGDLNGARSRLQDALQRRMKMGETGTAAETRLALAEVFVEDAQSGAAEPMARIASEEFHKEGEVDRETVAEMILARCLSAQGKIAEGQRIAARTMEHASKSRDKGVRLELLIGISRILLDGSSAPVALTLATALREAKKYGYYGRELDARLGLAELKAKSGDSTATRALAALEQEAKGRGFGLLARRAASARVPRSAALMH